MKGLALLTPAEAQIRAQSELQNVRSFCGPQNLWYSEC
jgi:hypothetical protein